MQHFEKVIGDNKLLYAWFLAMHTRVDVLLVNENSNDDLLAIATLIQQEIERFDRIANRFDENSELAQLNTSAFNSPVSVSDELFQLIKACLLYHASTLGLFDITIHSSNGFQNGIESIVLDEVAKTIRFAHPDVKLDLSGFVKGYVLRNIRQLLSDTAIYNALINVGNSSVLALGNHPLGKGWVVDTASQSFVLFNQCLTTSGNTSATKWPILHPTNREFNSVNQQLSVVSDDPALGEVLSKALYVASVEQQELILANFDATVKWAFS